MRLFLCTILVALLCSTIYGEAHNVDEDLLAFSAFNVSSYFTDSDTPKLDSSGPKRRWAGPAPEPIDDVKWERYKCKGRKFAA